MLIVRQSLLSGTTRSFDLPVTQEQLDSYKNGSLVQDAFPHLTADQREFIMTGATADEWDEYFGE